MSLSFHLFISFGVLTLFCFIDFSGCPKHRSIEFLMLTSEWVVCSILQFFDGPDFRGRFCAFLVRFCARKYLADVFWWWLWFAWYWERRSITSQWLRPYLKFSNWTWSFPTKMHLLRVVWCLVWAWYSFLLFWFWVHHDYHRSFLSMIFDT